MESTIYRPKQLTNWPLVEVAMLLIGLTQISFDKTRFDSIVRDQSALYCQLITILFPS
jgi:hypothetical protein